MSRLLVKLFTWIHDILHQPKKVFFACLSFALFSLLIQGGLFQVWSLHRDQSLLLSKINKIKQDTGVLNAKIERVSDPNYLELEVRNQLDYAEEGDLIFVFSDSE
ncbi:MAG: septum formation initiator family protein [Bdellovibrionaceae bacterium]|nr:septum formation initiator family protein [Pseudobdellovibrionaceae bacterium]